MGRPQWSSGPLSPRCRSPLPPRITFSWWCLPCQGLPTAGEKVSLFLTPVLTWCPRLMVPSLRQSERNQHIQACVRRDTAARQGHLVSDIHYCYHCFEWVVGNSWEEHCEMHLDKISVKRCGSVIHCHTLVRPGHCPICIGDVSLPPSERLKPWSRDHKLWVHINDKHLRGCQWPLSCCHPLCSSTSRDCVAFHHHLIKYAQTQSIVTCGCDEILWQGRLWPGVVARGRRRPRTSLQKAKICRRCTQCRMAAAAVTRLYGCRPEGSIISSLGQAANTRSISSLDLPSCHYDRRRYVHWWCCQMRRGLDCNFFAESPWCRGWWGTLWCRVAVLTVCLHWLPRKRNVTRADRRGVWTVHPFALVVASTPCITRRCW